MVTPLWVRLQPYQSQCCEAWSQVLLPHRILYYIEVYFRSYAPVREEKDGEKNVLTTQNPIILMEMSVLCLSMAFPSLPLGTELDESHAPFSHCSFWPSVKMLTWPSISGYLGDTQSLIVRQWWEVLLVAVCLFMRGKKEWKQQFVCCRQLRYTINDAKLKKNKLFKFAV